MIIKAGKFYSTENGEKVGPLRPYRHAWDRPDEPAFIEVENDGRLWDKNGVGYGAAKGLDLIAEWTDEPTGPVRTVTRKEIVPGTYGYVTTSGPNDAGVRITFPAARLNAAELRAAAAILTEIADALDEQEKNNG